MLDPGIDFKQAHKRYKDRCRGKGRRREADDITQALYFHFESFPGSETEGATVREVLRRARDLTRDLTLRQSVDLTKDEDNRIEKAICVLRRAGVVEEYDVEYGSKKIIAHFTPFEAGRSAASCADYVMARDPWRDKDVKSEVAAILESAHDTRSAHALAFASYLIGFKYDVVELSRRRMILEAMLLARTARTDDEIRQRILDYFSDDGGDLERLLGEGGVNLI